MPLFTYSGDDGRYYPELGLTCDDGQTVELDEAPGDGRFTDANGITVTAPDDVVAPTDEDAPTDDVVAHDDQVVNTEPESE